MQITSTQRKGKCLHVWIYLIMYVLTWPAAIDGETHAAISRQRDTWTNTETAQRPCARLKTRVYICVGVQCCNIIIAGRRLPGVIFYTSYKTSERPASVAVSSRVSWICVWMSQLVINCTECHCPWTSRGALQRRPWCIFGQIDSLLCK